MKNSLKRIRNSVASVVALLALQSSLHAAVIYSDNFTGSSSSDLGGQTTTTGGGAWVGSGINADGSFAGTGQETLPIAVTSGFVYELKATITVTSGDWGGITFSPSANPIWAAFASPFYGTLLSEGHYYSAGAAGYLGSSLGSGDYKIVLDTTQPNWSVTYYFNGLQQAVNTWTGGNPSIASAGIISYNGNGKFSKFEVTKAVPPPSVIYADNFSGSSSEDLNGKSTTTGGGTWSGSGIKADGSFDGTVGTNQTVLPITISSGFVYDIKTTITQASGNWAGITFSPTVEPIWDAFGSGFYGTMLDSGERYPGAIGSYLGSGDYDIQLDTRSANWTVRYFFNGTQVDSSTWSSGNPSIAYVGLITYNNVGTSAGKFSNFTVTQGVTTPGVVYTDNFSGSPSLSLSGQTTTTGGGIWGGASDDAIKADGSFSGTGQKVLPIAISSGFVYDIYAHITQTSGDWAGITFSPNANPIWAAFSSPFYGTMLDNGYYYSGGVGNLGYSLGTGDYRILLDTTQPNWSVAYFFNGVQKAVNTWTAGNPSIAYVGLVTYNNSGTSVGKFSNFAVTQQIVPGQPTLALSVAGSTLSLSWADYLGWTLQQQANALSTNWVDVPGSRSVTSTNFTINPSAPAVFYRLKL